MKFVDTKIVWVLLSVSVQVHAQNEIYLCVDEKGNRTYQNVSSNKSCRKIELQPLNSVPAPKFNQPRASGGTQTPGNFPRVDNNSQRVRDEERRRILQDELKAEEQKLADLKKEYNNGEPERVGGEKNYQKYLDRVQKMKEDIIRSEANIDGLKRELRNLPN